MASDDAVRATNDDASHCKRFAVEKNYWSDPYISMVTTRGQARHAPEISRGYYARVTAIRSMLQKFIKLTERQCQVVNLGAGSDTNYWLLKDLDLSPKSFVEVDFQTVTSKKVQQIKRQPQLLQKIATEDGEIQMSKSEIHGADYHLVECNLRNLKDLQVKLKQSDIDHTLPTIFIAECVLVYIDQSSVNDILKWITESFNTALFLNYEQVNMTDRFGEIMIENLKSRDCFLSGVDACASLDTQKERFISNKWDGADGMEMSTLYNCLPQSEIQRIEKIEFMDEKELLEQLLKHYCFVWAWKDPNNIGLSSLDFT